MNTNKPNKTLIGAFVIGAFILIIIAIGFFGSGKFFKETMIFALFFDRSISGLSIGSPVVFMGVPIGQVVDIRVDSSSNDINYTIPVYVELYKASHTLFAKKDTNDIKKAEHINALINKGLRANLAQQSILTGQLMIELSFTNTTHSKEGNSQLAFYKGVPIIPTIPSKLENILSELIELPINEIAHNILTFTDGINKLINTPNTPEMIKNLDDLIQNLNKTLVDFNNSSKQYKKMLETTYSQFNTTLKETEKTAHQINNTTQRLFSENSPTLMNINQALQEFSQSVRAFRNLINMLEQQPEAIIQGKNHK